MDGRQEDKHRGNTYIKGESLTECDNTTIPSKTDCPTFSEQEMNAVLSELSTDDIDKTNMTVARHPEDSLIQTNNTRSEETSFEQKELEMVSMNNSNNTNGIGKLFKKLRRYFVSTPVEGIAKESEKSELESSKSEKEGKAHRPSMPELSVVTISNDADVRRHSSGDTQEITMNQRESETEDTEIKPSKWKGIILACGTSVLFSLGFVIVKYMHHIHPGQLALFRFVGIFLFAIPLVYSNSGIRSIWDIRRVYHWLLLQGISGGVSNFLLYTSIQYLQMANAIVIALTQPIFVCIFARIFLKEPCGLFHVIALAVTIIGVLITTKLAFLEKTEHSDLPSKRNELWGLLCGIGSSMILAIVVILTRHLKSISLGPRFFLHGLVGMIVCFILMAIFDKIEFPICGMGPWLLCGMALVGFYSYYLLTLALEVEEAGLVSVTVFSANVLFAFLFQVTIFQDMPDAYSMGGASLVLLGVILVSLRKWAIDLPESSSARKRLWILLR